ncbi:MAG: hypothetical protein AB7Q29_15145 [Vicinamibacterales bacterium]
MRQTFIAGAAVLAFSIATSAAQSGSASQSGVETQEAGTITVSGCLERADQLIQSASNSLGTTVGSQDFALIKATAAGGTAPGSVGTSGSGPVAAGNPHSTAELGNVFLLRGKDEMFNPHVGQEVEVVGKRITPPTIDPTTAVPARAPLLRVESVKTLAAVCSR